MKRLIKKSVPNVPDRPVKILQFGEGNFLRGFVDWMVDVLNEKTLFNGNIQIIQPIPKGMGNAINVQDGLYHVLLEGIENGGRIQNSRLITSVKGVLNPYENYMDFLRQAENPFLEFIVSNTTEAGIVFDPTDRSPEVVPNSFPGKLTALLLHRFHHFDGGSQSGLTLLPCELIEKNGEKLKECILRYSNHWALSETFISWVHDNCIFYNTLVDRIVPGFPREQINEIQQRLGFKDDLIVKAEPFHLWVLQGPKDIKNQLDFNKAQLNVIVTDDLGPYRTRKVRILNGAHTAMVPYAYLNGFIEVREVVENKKMEAFLNTVLFEEIIPTIDMSKTELESYTREVLDRFRNPFIKHRLLDIALNSIAKFRVRVLPSLLTYLELYKKVPEGLATALAHLIVFYKGNHKGEHIAIRDDESVIAFFRTAWKKSDLDQTLDEVLSNKTFWGTDLTEKKQLSSFIKQCVKSLV
ncbi:tagaturonate reductase [uncultured Croceitalea sp.]|uniref:tagaturonate reductase n=1 Tax=uncultured Croceitalea sp. TaxID=1798908 RepID=UPI003305D59D